MRTLMTRLRSRQAGYHGVGELASGRRPTEVPGKHAAGANGRFQRPSDAISTESVPDMVEHEASGEQEGQLGGSQAAAPDPGQ